MDTIGMIRMVQMPQIHNREHFIAYVKFMHALLIAHEDLMDEAATCAHAASLCDYYRRHAEEERGHAAWLAEDIETLGAEVERADHAAASIAGSQYYYLRHKGAHVFLGYLIALECKPMPMGSVEKLEELVGKPGCRTLRYHAEHDPGHAAALKAIVREHEGDDGLVLYNGLLTAHMLSYYLSARLKHRGG